jgi:hypothetical protein
MYRDHFSISHSCRTCAGHFRVPDEAVGCYSLGAVVDGDGNIMDELTDAAMSDAFLAVYLCSPRRPSGIQTVAVVFPKNAPAAPQAEVIPRSKTPAEEEEDSDLDLLCDDVLKLKLEPTAAEGSKENKFRKASCIGSELDCCLAIQEWINKGAFGAAYDSVQVAKAYRLIGNSKADRGKMMDGGDNYIVIATLRGYGSQYCCNVKREHSNNHVYFELHSNGTAVQKCHSIHDDGCAKAKACSPSRKMPHSVFTLLYPYAQSTMMVLPEEVADWVSKRTPMSWLQANFGKIHGCTRTDGGNSFKLIVQNGRKKHMEAYLKRGNQSALGKRVSEEDHSEQPEHSCPWESDAQYA